MSQKVYEIMSQQELKYKESFHMVRISNLSIKIVVNNLENQEYREASDKLIMHQQELKLIRKYLN
ncbi:TPA: hypothetical protein ACGORG_002030 [Streptococcus suis]